MIRLLRALIDTHALRHNLGTIRAYAPRSKVMAVIKANAYGHGLVTAALALADADALAVARLEEGIALRPGDIVLILGAGDLTTLPDELLARAGSGVPS